MGLPRWENPGEIVAGDALAPNARDYASLVPLSCPQRVQQPQRTS